MIQPFMKIYHSHREVIDNRERVFVCIINLNSGRVKVTRVIISLFAVFLADREI